MSNLIQNNKVDRSYLKGLLKKNDLNKALLDYQEFIVQEKKIKQKKIDNVLRTLGEIIIKINIRDGHFDESINFFQIAIDKYPYKEWSYYNLGEVFSKQDKIDEAIKCYEKAHETRTEFDLSVLKLGLLMLKQGNRDKAFECGLQIIDNQAILNNYKSNMRLFRLLGAHFKEQESKMAFQKVIEAIEKLDSRSKAKAVAYRNIAVLLRAKSKFSDSSDFYQKSLHQILEKSNPEFVNNYWNIGKLQEPDFLVVGFGKCGTTSFYDYLCQHPQVLTAVRKEPGYLQWLVHKTKNKNIDSVDWSLPSPEKDLYLAHFAPRPEEKKLITGEASTSNIIPGIEKIIFNWFPNIKLIFLVRDPIRRTISHYEQRLKGGKQKRTLSEIINSELDELDGLKNPTKAINRGLWKGNGWVEHLPMSLYVYTIMRWMNLFPKEQFLILQSEDLAQYPAETMKQALDFLGLPECNSMKYEPRNVGSYPQIDADLLDRLSKFFKPHNRKLEKFLGRKFDWD